MFPVWSVRLQNPQMLHAKPNTYNKGYACSALGIELLSSACFVYPVQNSIYEHTIIIDMELKRIYRKTLLPELPKGWKWYTQTVTDDHLSLFVLGYSEQFVWLGFQSIKQRVQEITAEFLAYLDNRNKTVLAAVMLLMDS